MDAPKGTTSEAAERIKSLLTPKEEPQAEEPPENQPEDTETSEAEVQPEVRTFRVKVDGEEIEVPEDELLKGYSRNSDYTRKTQKLSEERKALEAEASRVKEEREQYSNALKVLKDQLNDVQEPDWQRLQAEDPIEYLKQKELYRDRKEKLALVEQEQRRVAELQTQEQQKAFQKYIQDEHSNLLDALPEWKDAKVAKAEKEKIANFALSLGYTEADISQIYDHRAVVALRKAALYDEMMSKAKTQTEKVKDSPKTVTPGSLQPSLKSREFKEKREQLRATGRVNDFVSAFKALNRR